MIGCRGRQCFFVENLFWCGNLGIGSCPHMCIVWCLLIDLLCVCVADVLLCV